MIVIADTGPIHYLVLSNCIDVLPELYGSVVIPETVKAELNHLAAPSEIRRWISATPDWVSFKTPAVESGFERLGPGERDALRLALEMSADLVLIDESLARRLATENRIAVKGTLGVLEEAAQKLNLDLRAAVDRLRLTGIYLDEKTIVGALERDRTRREREGSTPENRADQR
jgi:predicted nucleic acid-binding protein